MTSLLASRLRAWLPQKLEKALEAREKEYAGAPLGRLFYLALPPSVYPQVNRQFQHERSHFTFTVLQD